MKVAFKPGTLLYPLPVVMVTCGDAPDNWNIVTVAWTGTLCTEPPLCYISLRPTRHSHALITRTGEFVINLTTAALARQTDWCGVRSGRDTDKFQATGLHAERAQLVKAPLIQESPLNLECRVREVKSLGSHDMFIAEVVAVDAEEALIDKQSGHFHLNHAQPLSYSHGKYYALGERLGGFGFSVRKKEGKNKKRQEP